MNFGFLRIPWFGVNPKRDSDLTLASTSTLIEQPKQKTSFEIRLWGWTLVSVPPKSVNGNDRIRAPTTINKGLKRRAQQHRAIEPPNGGVSIRFRPYVCKVPWHTGARAFLSQLFPRYGHYCGPNWSSGKDRGSLIWDRRPIDWLDFCCYCHDIGYDTHDQEKLLKADLAFLECLERPHMSTKGDPSIAQLYKTMCITGMLCRGLRSPRMTCDTVLLKRLEEIAILQASLERRKQALHERLLALEHGVFLTYQLNGYFSPYFFSLNLVAACALYVRQGIES